jgi:single-strand DNA-binding protein
MNNVNVTGRLTRKPELVETKANIKISTLRVAIARRGDAGAVFCDVKTFGKQAAACVEHLDKGRLVAIEGRLELDQWESKGQKRSRLYIVGERVEFIDRPTDEPAKAAAEALASEGETERVAAAA